MALGAQQQKVKIWKTGQLSRHYIVEISLNETLNHNQTTYKVKDITPNTKWIMMANGHSGL